MRILIFLLLGLQLCAAEFNPFKTVPEVRLADGRVLLDFRVVSYVGDGVNATWKDGKGVVSYDLLPPEWDHVVARFRPKNHPPESITPVPRRAPPPVESPRPQSVISTRRKSAGGNGAPTKLPLPILDPISAPKFDYEKSLLSRKIEGQCFIVTKGGNSVKLGLVQVSLYPISVYEQTIKKVEDRQRSYRNSITPILDEAHRNSEHSRWLDVYAEFKQTRRLLWRLVPPSPLGAKTDADGRFVLSHDVAGEFVLFATAQRQISDDVEHYVWIVHSREIPADGKLFLSNDNSRS